MFFSKITAHYAIHAKEEVMYSCLVGKKKDDVPGWSEDNFVWAEVYQREGGWVASIYDRFADDPNETIDLPPAPTMKAAKQDVEAEEPFEDGMKGKRWIDNYKDHYRYDHYFGKGRK